MRVTKEKAAENRAALIEAASRLFRERGLDAVGVAEIARAAGLTHGAFYSHFKSKEAIAAVVCEQAIGRSAATWRDAIGGGGRRGLASLIKLYLSPERRAARTALCVFAALGCDLSRTGKPVRRAATRALPEQIALLEDLVPGRTRAARRKRALAAYASMVGAMVMARAVDDPALGDEILRAAGQELMQAL